MPMNLSPSTDTSNLSSSSHRARNCKDISFRVPFLLHQAIHHQRLFRLISLNIPVNHRRPRVTISLRHFIEHLPRFLDQPSLRVTVHHHVPRTHISVRHFVEHLPRIDQAPAFRVHSHQTVADNDAGNKPGGYNVFMHLLTFFKRASLGADLDEVAVSRSRRWFLCSTQKLNSFDQ
ncbi:hypothetical protein BRARA_A00178 [Brassica rapa]|uniref:Uncharacterized protein n=1 Tax=Brassica campestris TaxID=3711 RepID=A0A398ANN9_BRACM|nr:hypothetical protein BRARA_A00178 [Brassica rapa]